MVTKGDVLELDFAAGAAGERQGLGVGLFGDGHVDLLQVEEGFHVEKRLAQFAVDGTEEVERYGKLEDELVDQNQVADGQLAGGHAVGAHVHHYCQGGGEDDVLARVEEGKRGGDLDAVLLVLGQGLVVAADLVGFVVEVLDGFVVDERVNSDGRRLVIRGVGLATELGAPCCRENGKRRVADHGQGRQRRKLPAKVVGQNTAHHGDLQRGRHNVEHHAGQEEADALGTTVDGPSQPTRLFRQMEAQIQIQQMAKSVLGHLANRLLRNRREHRIPQFLRNHRAYPRRTVSQNHGARHGRDRSAGCRKVDVERVDNLAEVKGYLDVEHLAANKQADGQHHARLVAPAALGPQVFGHFLHDGPVGLALLLRGFVNGGEGVYGASTGGLGCGG